MLSALSVGASKPWKDVMEIVTGKPTMNTGAFKEYFEPLEKWLKEENKKNGVYVGWKVKPLDQHCNAKTGQPDLANVSKFIEEAESKLLKGQEKLQYRTWDFASNITDHNEKNKINAQVFSQHRFTIETIALNTKFDMAMFWTTGYFAM